METKSSFKHTLNKMKHVGMVFIIYSVLVVLISFLTKSYNNSFITGFFVNANSSILDFFVLGVVLYYFEYRKQNNETISELLEDLENLAKHSSIELNIKKIKLIRKLNSKGVYNIQAPRMELNKLSTIKYLHFKDAELSGLNMEKSNIRDCTFKDCSIQALNINESKLKNIKFINCKIKNIKASNATFLSVTFENCFLEGGNFSKSDIKSCIIKKCNLKDIIYKDANLRSANILQSFNVEIERIIEAKNLDYLVCEENIKTQLKAINENIKFTTR
ncbi:TPA: pentapeptide repeat-containing protein [Yersinia enterocolitica]|nr:pentapeptide repeat-containing protein [Yersinia enterocolitica]ELX2300608.1 pentapeptide repeat-containing protein [Yersinia enterocolitica]HDL7126750.1 pentapeptide repeat-containing protein [Yersinia enterocolitica]HDL7210610.1 pentapeptide repeat-containing protein [Yersinia enterocolitica]HDL7214839.1 pentapeptide repeat-containing protein [Yersinia enterocolitica]